LRILIVEDTEDVADAILSHFSRQGHVCEAASNLEDAAHFLGLETYDLVILDINLPDGSGLDFLKKLRAAKNGVPVLVLTARLQVDDKIDALDFGADDYLVKPFDLRELEARARAVTRRKHGANEATVLVGNLLCNFADHSVRVDDADIELTRREFILLEAFMSNLNRVLQKEELYSRLYGLTGEAGLNAVEVYVARLRRKLADATLEIRTLRGLGYQAVPGGRADKPS
jgi:two-component system response regulator TctD